nr:hypothetical protein GCM10020093_028690 [Planobispora longispora]
MQAGRLNDRYFYESFTDLDALLLAVVDDQAARGTAVILAAASAPPHRLRARARAVVEAIVDFLSADPRRGRVLAHEFSAHPLLPAAAASSGPWRPSSPPRSTNCWTRSRCRPPIST